ncbi:leucine-rich repeat neuronal protein 3-like [Gigantopelta aegis]|uniref:leucine-rich repeat neuronal protein 3-like n=1 Tax=Gigantopelta aegis TaxID=1735272 RepID=UPI001B8890B0|nr:leucine-rich repeat neuronal protein 3-like [Gigantopelta aegis]
MGNATSWPSSGLIFLALWSLFSFVSTCPSNCTCSNTTWKANPEFGVYCVHTDLDSVPFHIPQQVNILDLHGNGIQSLNECLNNLTDLKFLNLSFNHLASLNASVFDNLQKLKTLDISYNVISAIQSKAFSDMINIDDVNLSGNRIRSIESDILFGLHMARMLNFSMNEINNISNGAFQFMKNLKILDFSNNKINVISIKMLQGLKSLTSLHLENNKIHTIEPGSFTHLGSLQELDMSSNKLTTLDKDVLSGLSNLTTLSLQDNCIKDIDLQFMDNAENVIVLRLSGNSFHNISIPVFTMLRNLQELYLSNMPCLITVAFNAFHGLSTLLTLDLSHNTNLSFIHPDLFDDLQQLLVLDLSHNNISMLSELTFLHNKHLQQVFLEANVFQCTCGIAWLAGSLLVNISVFKSENLECAVNDTYSIPLSMLSGFELCPALKESNVTETEVVMKLAHPCRLICEFVPDPMTMVVWKTPRQEIFTYHPFHPQAASHLLSTNITDLHSSFHRNHPWHNDSGYYSDLEGSSDHIVLLSDGSLYIDYILRKDAGPYECLVQNSHYNSSQTVTIRLVCAIFQTKITSLIVGASTALVFLVLTILYSIIMIGAQRLINKRRRDAIRKLLENLDTYKNMQFSRLRDNYSNQLGRIRDQYHLQFGRLRENYALQMKRVRKGYSDKVDRIRDNYTLQVIRLRQYSAHQIEQIRELYNNQLLRIRDYSSLQMGRMHEKYKLQQQHVIKLLETMNLDNCKNLIDTECMRAESKIYELNINVDDDEQPLSPLESDSEYHTATSSENSSHENLCIPVAICINENIGGTEDDFFSQIVQVEPKAGPDSPVLFMNNGINCMDDITETIV